MKKVLIIANLFHASPRIPGVTAYLPEFDWEATIITPPLGSNSQIRLGFSKKFLEKAKIVEAPYRGDIFWFWRKVFKLFGFRVKESITEQIKERVGITSKRSFIDVLMNWYQMIFAYPDTEKTWKKPALKYASEIIKQEHFDAILSSSPFPTTHMIAAELKKRFDVPWLADFRDPWTQNHNYPYGSIRKRFEEKLERRLLSIVDALIAASPAYAKKQEKLHQRPCRVITNGFDPEDVNNPPIPLTEKFTITYTGQIYTGKQDPEKLLLALKELISQNKINPSDIEVRFFGPRQSWFDKKIVEYGLNSIVRQFGIIPRHEALQRQKESQILLLLNWEDPKERGVYTTKFFEYLSAQRPILVTGGFPGDEMEKLIVETKVGIHAPSVDKVITALLTFYEEYKRCGKISYNGNLNEINKYSYRELAKRFVDILNKIIKKNKDEKSFYQAGTAEEALKIYYQSELEVYAQIKNQIIETVTKKNLKPHFLKVLEVGAGGGIWTDFFIKRGAVITCIDICKTILEGNAILHPSAKFVLGDATNIQLGEKFDLIFAKDVIEHIKDDEKFLKNMNRHLKDQGFIIINTQNSFSLNFLIQGGYHFLRGNRNWLGWDPTHFRFYNVISLKKKLSASGFKPIKWFGSYYFPYRILSDRLGKWADSKIFCFIELWGFCFKFPFNILGWNIGVLARKIKSI
jgi:2-polyprenyl-3-methyl-5-hydroxy-6-metoxy-1,4-benzoquinol methylase